jgi:hypothetical protein
LVVESVCFADNIGEVSTSAGFAAQPDRRNRMGRFKGILAGIVALTAMAVGQQAQAAISISISNYTDSGTLVTDFQGPPGSQSSNSVPSPYGSGTATVTPITPNISYKLTFNVSSGFFASANNLSGGKSSTFDGLIAFDIDFGEAVNLTTNIFEDGIWAKSGNGRVDVKAADLPSGAFVHQLDNLGAPESHGGSFWTNAIAAFNPNGTWNLYNQVGGFTKAYRKYHIVIDNALIAESVASQTPGFAAIAKKDFSIIFTFDGSNGGGPIVPEPASLGVLALGSLAMLARRRK